jgi:hypothetical protein
VLFLFNNANAEWKNSFSLNSNYDQNPFHYQGSEPININSTNILLAYKSADNSFGLNLNTNYSLIPNLAYAQLNDNTIGIKFNNHFGANNESDLIFTGMFGFKLNSGDFSYYNNNHYDFSVGYNYRFSEITSLSIGNVVNLKDYYSMPDFSYMENVAYIGLKTSFETNTSISAEVDYGYKNFSDKLFSFSGKGKNNTSASQSFAQAIASVKIGQSLADRTGLSLLLAKSMNLSSTTSDLLSFNPDLVFEKDIYDDSYTYQSNEATLTLSHYTFFDIKLQLFGFYFAKDYSYQYSEDVEIINPNRADKSSGIGLNLEKSFGNLKVNMNYNYTNNSSNTPVFDYNSNYFGVGFKLGF